MNARATPAQHGERGFLLVGVIMFMLALTILGLSLFALSSYEAQFFTSSASREQSLHSSESGIELVKRLLAIPPYRLENAQLAVGQFGITRALAYQSRSSNADDTTSNGPVNWDSTLVIVVAARSGGEERAIQSRFVPQAIKNPYRQLVTAGRGIQYSTFNAEARTVELQGGVWQPVDSDGDTAWTSYVNWTVGRPLDRTTPPTPKANEFVDANRPLAALPDPDDQELEDEPYFITMRNPAALSNPKFYRSLASPHSGYEEHDRYEFFSDKELEVRISGTVVWVVDQGVCFRHTVRVVPDPETPDVPGVLVLVAKPGRDPDRVNRAIWFQGGLEVTDPELTQVFLVSEGDIAITHHQDKYEDQDVNAVSIVAGGVVRLMGPESDYDLKLAYHPDTMDSIADLLLSMGGLPATSAGSGTSYAFARQSWLETRLP